jgi:hypothetical protein
MASTRKINNPENYFLEQKQYQLINDYRLYTNSSNGSPYEAAIPTLGYIPSHMNASVFSNNPIEIESALFGINANNLVFPQKPIVPSLNTITFKSYFNTLSLEMPKPLLLQPKQRPFPVP